MVLIKLGRLQDAMNKLLGVFLLLLACSIGSQAGEKAHSGMVFRFLGEPGLSESELKEYFTQLLPQNDSDLKSTLLNCSGTIIRDLYNLEKAVRNANPDAQEKSIEQLAADLKEMRKNPVALLIFRSCYASVLESTARILQSPNGQHLSKEQLQKALSPELLTEDDLKFFRSYANMLLLARELMEIRRQTGTLPRNLEQIPGQISLDAWGNPIQYREENQKYLLWSANRGEKAPAEIQGYIPAFDNRDVLVFSEDFSELREKLYQEGEIMVPPSYVVKLSKGEKNWTLSGHSRSQLK